MIIFVKFRQCVFKQKGKHKCVCMCFPPRHTLPSFVTQSQVQLHLTYAHAYIHTHMSQNTHTRTHAAFLLTYSLKCTFSIRSLISRQLSPSYSGTLKEYICTYRFVSAMFQYMDIRVYHRELILHYCCVEF